MTNRKRDVGKDTEVIESDNPRPIICWFRRDLRVRDNPALFHAASTGLPVIPIFIVDTELIEGIKSDGAVFDFQAECLQDLATNIEEIGGRLIVRTGTLTDVFSTIIGETHPRAVYFDRDYEPSAMARDLAATKFLSGYGIDVKSFDDVTIHHPEDIKTSNGGPYAVFSPFAARWRKLPKPKPLGKPSRFTTPRLSSEPIPGGEELGRERLIVSPIVRGGEKNASNRWNSFLRERLLSYADARDLPQVHGTSKMSPYLRFGCISPVRMYWDLAELSLNASERMSASTEKLLSEMIWREFYTHVLYHFPYTAERNFRNQFDLLKWAFDERAFKAWKEGRTGFPLVDAGMRQLNATGWMHNRVRMVTASFLTKDLFIDWRHGEMHFATKLLDIEKASNVGGWQWSASTGVDPRPLRIFNPVIQSRRFDPEGIYIKEWVPELRKVPPKYVHEPARMSPALQEETGVVPGKDYPLPIVDHRAAAEYFKGEYAKAKAGHRPSKLSR